MNKTDYQIILASASPRRAELLGQIGVNAKIFSVDIDETLKQGETPLDYVQRLAMEKARAGYAEVFEKRQSEESILPVLGSDTIVEINGCVLGKPESRQHAKEILRQLSGNHHLVHTSVAMVAADKSRCLTSSTEVYFAKLEDDVIERYVATGEADDKAGAYAIQGIAAQFVKRINGSYSGVMGLPLYETAKLLKQFGAINI